MLESIDLSAIREKTETWGSSKVLFKSDKAEIGLFKCSPGKSMDMHKHKGLDEAIYVLEGNASFEDERGQKDLGEGAAVFIPRDIAHKAFNKTSKDHVCLYIVSSLK